MKVIKELIYHRNKILSFCKDLNNKYLVIGDSSGVYSVIDI